MLNRTARSCIIRDFRAIKLWLWTKKTTTCVWSRLRIYSHNKHVVRREKVKQATQQKKESVTWLQLITCRIGEEKCGGNNLKDSLRSNPPACINHVAKIEFHNKFIFLMRLQFNNNNKMIPNKVFRWISIRWV